MRPLLLCLLLLVATGSSFAQSPTPTATPAPSPVSTPTPQPTPIGTVRVLEVVTVEPAVQSIAAPATTGTIAVNLSGAVVTITPTGNCTFNTTTSAMAGREITFVITTSGTTSRVLTWGTNFRAAGTLATGTVTARVFCVTFKCLNGTLWVETGRTAAM